MKTFIQKLIKLLLLPILLNCGATIAQSNIVTINSGGNLELNGTPFFMNAIYSGGGFVAATDLTRMRDAGINTVLAYGQRDMDYLDRVQAAGLKVIMDFSALTRDGDLNTILSSVKAYKNHPALLGWYAFDELNDTVKTEKVYAMIKAEDSSHLVWAVTCCFDGGIPYKGYKKSADIIGFDIYAVGHRPQEDYQSQIYEWSRWIAAEYTPPSHTIMGASQIFNKYSYDDYGGNTREPTLQDKRLGAYLFLAGGNKGHFFYSYFDILVLARNNQPWPQNIIDKNLQELPVYGQEIGDVGRLAILNGTEFIRQEQGDTTFLKTIGYKESNDDVYVLAANISMSNSQTVTVDIPLTAWQDADVSVLYGDLKVIKVGSRLQITTPGGESGTIRIRKPINQSGINLALNKTVTASSTEAGSYGVSNAVDGDNNTRWASDGGVDPQWIYVDLGATYNVNGVKLNWEVAYAKSYKIQVSDDATNWTDIYNTPSGDGSIDDLTNLSGTGRYVRMYGTERGTEYGYSLWEFEVYGSSPDLINNEVYELAPSHAQDMRLDVSASGNADGTNVQIYEANNGNAQRWKLLSNGSNYELAPLCAPNSRLDVSGSGNSNETNVQIWQANNSSAQQWQLQKVSDGVYELAPLCAIDKRLDVAGFGTSNYTNVFIWDGKNATNQRWLLKKVAANKSSLTDGFNNRQSFSVFPNPSNGNFNVTYDNLEKGNYVLEVNTLLGQNVYKESLTNISGNINKPLSIPNKEKGVYIITLTNSNGNKISKKLVVN